MTLQLRDMAIFRDLARYRFLDRRQIQRLHFPDDATGRACRRRLLEPPSKNCKTCGSEIVESINDSNFHEGECGHCEYQRYRTQPELLHACGLALDEIDQWVEVMGGSEDPRTGAAIHALVAAIAEATETNATRHPAEG